MKKFRLLLIAVLVAVTALFGMKQTAWAGPAQAGSVNNPSGQDSGPCDTTLKIGFAIGYINGTRLEGCTGRMYKVDVGGTPYDGFSPISYPVYIGTNQGDYDYQYQVTVCYPLNISVYPEAGVYRYEPSARRWFPAPFYYQGNMICGYWWGSSILGVFTP